MYVYVMHFTVARETYFVQVSANCTSSKTKQKKLKQMLFFNDAY